MDTSNCTTQFVDRHGRTLGTFEIETTEPNLWAGTFRPGPDYPAVAPLFAEFDELANGQVLSLIDDVMDRIADLGIRLSDGTPVYDVQIYLDGAASCRPSPPEWMSRLRECDQT